jgi:membrane protease YdiL (CAAX protease family)
VLLWVAAALVLAAVISPGLYHAGKNFAELADEQGLAGVLGWVGKSCRRAEFARYFKRSVLLAALLLMPLLFRRLRQSQHGAGGLLALGPPLAWRTGLFQWMMGLLIAGGVLWGVGMMMERIGAFTAYTLMPSTQRVLTQALIPALAVSVVEECLFRGLLLGLWLRVARPAVACIGSSLLYAFLHFLTPPPGIGIADPFSALAGFQQLRSILLHFTEPRFFAADFLTLFAVGMILAGARLRTGRLWLCMGLHCGWVIAFKVYNLTYLKVPEGPLSSWWIGENLRSGLLPLAALGVTAAICHGLLKCNGDQAKGKPAPGSMAAG